MIADIAAAIRQATGNNFVPTHQSALGGGCINQAYKLGDGQRRFFVKTNQADCLGMFEAEFAGLEELRSAQAIRVPRPICLGITGLQAWLVVEYLDLAAPGVSAQSNSADLGRQLALLHHQTAPQFGWKRDNTIGSTPQINTWSDNWIAFLGEQRLGYQLRLAHKNGYVKQLVAQGERLMAHLADFFPGYQPVASLLHGDLWGGNAAFTVSGEPVIFDPAVYYGDREADLAMTELFGGFGRDFYAAYREAWPPDSGYATRKTLYNLYHILNHANLFGGAYPDQAENMIQRLLAICK